jgi:tetratricopeptide (TPR) repeat protein
MSPYLLREEILVLRDKWQGQPSPDLYRELSELLFTAGKIPAAMNLMERSFSPLISPLHLEDPDASEASSLEILELLEKRANPYDGRQDEELEEVGESKDTDEGARLSGSDGSLIESKGERWFRRGLEYADACLYEEACNSLSIALAMGYDGFETHYCLAGMHKSLGRLGQAESHCRKAMEYNPAFCPAFILLGAIVKLEGRLLESAEAVQKALFIDPDCAPAHYDLACYRALAGEIDPAFEALETALLKGFRDFDWMNRDPDLGPLRAFPEFAMLLEIYTPKKAENPA